MEEGQAVLRIERGELRQKSGRLGAGPGEGGIDRPEDWREGAGLMKLKQPAAHLLALGADGQQMKELLILPHRPVQGEQMLQSGGIEVRLHPGPWTYSAVGIEARPGVASAAGPGGRARIGAVRLKG